MEDAAIGVDSAGEKLTVSDAVTGYSFIAQNLRDSLNASATAATTDINIMKPGASTEKAQQFAQLVGNAVGDSIAFTYDDQTYKVGKKTVLSWLSFADADSNASTLEVSADQAKMAASFDSAGLIDSVATRVMTQHGNAVADPASLDDAVDYAKIAAALSRQLITGTAAAVPITVTDAAQKQAEAIAAERAAAEEKAKPISEKLKTVFGSATVSVKVINLKDSSVVVDMDSAKDFTSASTYKLYVAYSMLDAVEKGKESWSSPLNGTTLDTCLTRMIVNSDNACPQAWLSRYGFDAVTQQANALGASGTHFKRSDMHTTAADLSLLLTKLYKGEILSDASRQKLFALMQRQVYRKGIPAGIASNGTVADKVGFLHNLLHDAAIVTSQKGDYVMVIMTDNSSWNTIAKAAQVIYDSL